MRFARQRRRRAVCAEDHLAAVHADAEVEHLLPDGVALAVDGVEPVFKHQSGFAGGGGVLKVVERRAENDAHTLAVALVEVSAVLDQEVRDVAPE